MMDYEGEDMGGEEKPMGGFCVVIEVSPDGQMSVGTAKKEALSQGGYEKEMSMKPVGGMREAMETAMEALKNGGEMAEGEDEDFNSGFGKPQKTMVNREMSQEEV